MTTKTHGFIDYATGAALIAAPSIFRLRGMAAQLPRIIGMGIIGQALTTRYELGAIRSMPMRAHLAADMATGAMLAVSPFLFGFYGTGLNAWLPHVAAGASEVAVAAMTDPKTNTVTPEDPVVPQALRESVESVTESL